MGADTHHSGTENDSAYGIGGGIQAMQQLSAKRFFKVSHIIPEVGLRAAHAAMTGQHRPTGMVIEALGRAVVVGVRALQPTL